MQKRLLQNLKLFLVLDSSQSESGNPECSSERNPIAGGGTFVQNDRGKMNSDRSLKPGGGSGGTQDIDMRAQLAQKQASHAPPSPPWYQATSKQAVAGSPALSLLPLPLSVSSVQAMPACSYTAALRTTEVSAQRGRQKVQRRTQRCVDSGLMNCCIMSLLPACGAGVGALREPTGARAFRKPMHALPCSLHCRHELSDHACLLSSPLFHSPMLPSVMY